MGQPGGKHSRRRRRVGVLLPIGFTALLLTACGGADTPRWASVDAPSSANSAGLESPRRTVVVAESPDVGTLVLSGLVVSDSSTEVLAPGDGIVAEGRFATGDVVEVGDTVLTFTPSLSVEQQLEHDILELEVQLAMETQDAVAEAAALEALDELDDQQEQRGLLVESSASGVISGVRRDLEYLVELDEVLFTVSDPTDVIVRVISVSPRLPVSEGDQVKVRLDTGEALDARVETISVADSSNEIEISVLGDLPPGQLVEVEVSVSRADDGSSAWIPADALHSFSGGSYLLIERPGGSLDRANVRVGRRTDTHAEIGEDSTGRLPVAPGDVLVLP